PKLLRLRSIITNGNADGRCIPSPLSSRNHDQPEARPAHSQSPPAQASPPALEAEGRALVAPGPRLPVYGEPGYLALLRADGNHAEPSGPVHWPTAGFPLPGHGARSVGQTR